MFTAASAFLKALSDSGITHAFVNWGSDHPALLEELERQRVESGETSLQIVISPNEMVALSAAQGYAQVTRKPAAVIVHVDVGTQAMAGAIHNVDRGRTPVLIYAGASPFSSHRELKGTRNEWIFWLQDIPDQPAILRQYMRHTAQINSGKNVAQVVQRSLQIATSEPKGPVYMWARREVMEEELDASILKKPALQSPAIDPGALSPASLQTICTALLEAKHPLIITSHLGRNPSAVEKITQLSIPTFSTCPSTVNIPFSHPSYAGISYLQPGSHTPHLKDADVLLCIDVEIPWIPINDAPGKDARVFVIDSGDPLKLGVGSWDLSGIEMICKADAEVAIGQILDALGGRLPSRLDSLKAAHQAIVERLDAREVDTTSVPYIIASLRQVIRGHKPLVLNEAISNYPLVWEHLRPEVPGSVLTSGGSSLGWSLAAAVGAFIGGAGKWGLITAVVGDGSFLFGVPSSVYWMARKYETPFLTIVLNNGGWKPFPRARNFPCWGCTRRAMARKPLESVSLWGLVPTRRTLLGSLSQRQTGGLGGGGF